MSRSSEQKVQTNSPPIQGTHRIGVLAASAESALGLRSRLEAEGSFSVEVLQVPLEPPVFRNLDALLLEDVFPHLDALAVLESLPPGTPPVLVLGVHDFERSSRLLEAGIRALLSPEDATLEQMLRRVIREVELEQKVERAELERSLGEQRLRLALESGRMGLWDWNTVSGDIEADERTLELFGFTLESFDGEVDTLFAGIHPEDLPGVMAVVNEALQNETPYRSDYRILFSNENGTDGVASSLESQGSVLWIRSQGHPYRRGETLCVVGFVEDISAEVETRRDLERLSLERSTLLERRLTTSEDRLSRLVNTLPVVVFALDAQGRFTLSEGQALHKLGLQPGQVVGQSALELYRDQPALTRSLEAALSGQNLTVDHTMGQNTLSQSTFENHYTAVHNASGEVEGVFGIAFDVTENRRLERERRAAQDTSEVLSTLTDALTLAATPQAAAQMALDRIGPLLKLETALVARRRGENLHTLEFWGPQLPEERAVLSKGPIPLALTPGAARMFETQQALYVKQFGTLNPSAPELLRDQAVGYEPIRFSSGEVVGMLSVRRVQAAGEVAGEAGDWSAPERDLLRRAAATLGLALERTEREAALEAARARSELLAALVDVLFVQSTSQGVFEVASEHLAGALGLDYTCLMRPEARAGDEVLKLFYVWGTMPPGALSGSTQGFARSGGGMTWTALSQGEGVYATDYLSAPGHLDLELPNLALGVEPVRGADGVVRATLSVGRSSARGEWTAGERDLLARAARTVGLALERTEREAALEESRAQAELLAHLSDSLQSAQTPDAVARRAMERLCVVLSAQTMLFIQLEGDSLLAPLICGEVPPQARPFINTARVPLSSAPVLSRVVGSREALYLDDYALEPDALANFPSLASAVVPVCKPSGELEGVLVVWRSQQGSGWKSTERDLLRRTASTVGVALERSQFVESLQERFDFVLESAGLGMWDWDVQSGAQHWSPEQEKLFGLEPGGFDGTYQAYRAHLHPDDLEPTERRAEMQLDPSGPDEFEHEFRILHPAGVRWLYGRGRIERDAQRRALRISGVNFDITERKVQQQILERTLERFNRAQSAARGWVYELNLQTDLVERSSGVSEVLGYSPQELAELESTALGWRSLIHPDDLAHGREVTRRALEQGGPYSVEYRVRHSAGHYLEVWERGDIETDASGTPTRIVASTVDISERRAFEQALKESEEFANSVLESSPDCIKVLDLSGRILRMNTPGQAVMEIDDFASVQGCPWHSLWPLEMEATVSSAVLGAGAGQTVHFQGQTATQKGSLKWWDVVVAPVRGASGEVQRLVSVSRDMTAQREVYQSLVEREAELREAHDAQRRFVNDLAHELRTPLTAIGGNLELMLRYPQMTAQDRQEAVGEALSESQRLGRLATDLLALARGDAGVDLEMSELELRPILLEVWKETGRLARGHTLELGRLEPLEVEGHRDRLKQLTLILLDNALKYTPAPGRVALELVRDGKFALLKVMDGGPGIPEADLPRVFERFYRVRRATQDRESDPGGTGLGLPIAQWIATQHGGSIWLESELGRGTTVFVRLPLLEAEVLEGEVLLEDGLPNTPRALQ